MSRRIKGLLTKGLAVALSLTLVAGLGISTFAEEDYDYGDYDDDDDDGYIDDIPDAGPQDPYGVPDPISDDSHQYDPDGYIIISAGNKNISVGSTTGAHADVYMNVYGGSTSVDWGSSNSSVASVESAGNDVVIRGNSAGTAYISVTLYSNGRFCDNDGFYITVTSPQPTYIGVNGITISTTNMTLNAGGSQKLSASVTPSNANNKGIIFRSNNDSVAWVSGDGVVHANAAGTCVVTAQTSENGFCAYCNVTVNGNVKKNLPVTGVKVEPNAITINVNSTTAIAATVFPLGASNSRVLWDSSNPKVAVVDANGNITAKSVGTVNINCTTVEGNYKAYCVVTVVPANAKNSKQGTVVASKTRSAELNFKVGTDIMNAKKNATVTIVAPSPMSYDSTVATLLATRPDIKLQCTFPFNGYVITLTLPKKYDLAKQLDKTGYVEWLDLCAKKGVDVKMVKK